MKYFKVYIAGDTIEQYLSLKNDLDLYPVEFGTDSKFLFFGGKSYIKFSAPDSVAASDIRKYDIVKRARRCRFP
jgi:hypothetical protein